MERDLAAKAHDGDGIASRIADVKGRRRGVTCSVMPRTPPNRGELGEATDHLLSLCLTQLSVQVTLSTSLTASALGLATLATALTSTILTVQGAIAPHWQWTLLPSTTAMLTGLLATAVGNAENIDRGDVHTAYELAKTDSNRTGATVANAVRRTCFENETVLLAKQRLMAATFAWLLASALLIGILNVGSSTLGA